MVDTKIALARAWYHIQEQMKKLKSEESDLRKEVISSYFGDKEDSGTSKESLNENLELVLTRSATLGIDKDEFEKFETQLKADGLIGPDSVIVLKPVASLTAYKYLPENLKVKYRSVFVHGVSAAQLKTQARKA